MSFDATFVEIVDDRGQLAIGRYGIFEIQTMDFHGGYQQATDNLRNAAHLHRDSFADAINANPQWAGEKVEGPNIANTFKRTFYQMMFKFQIGSHGHGAERFWPSPKLSGTRGRGFWASPSLSSSRMERSTCVLTTEPGQPAPGSMCSTLMTS